MTHEQIVQLIKEAIHEVAPGKVNLDGPLDLTSNIRDLGIDSVASMEMAGVVEERLNLTFPDEDLDRVATLGDLAQLVQTMKG